MSAELISANAAGSNRIQNALHKALIVHGRDPKGTAHEVRPLAELAVCVDGRRGGQLVLDILVFDYDFTQGANGYGLAASALVDMS